MSHALTHEIRSGAVKGKATFSGPRSLQLFVEGLHELQSYELSPNPKSLRSAAETLEQCVNTYPSDVLPQFYLGVVKTLEGYGGADEAIRLFSSIRESGPDFLRQPAEYNLAAAHVEKYSSVDFDIAESLLREMKGEFESGPESESSEKHALKAQVLSLLAFCVVRQKLWRHRTEPDDASHETLARTAIPESQALLAAAEGEASKLTGPVKDEVLADWWNVKGLLFEYQAHRASTPRKEELAKQAVEAFDRALKLRRDWIAARSNMARVYQDLLSMNTQAEPLWRAVLTVRPDDEYSHYMLGRIDEQKKSFPSAFAHYAKAPHIPEAVERLETLKPLVPWWEQPAPPPRTAKPEP
jgi:tetratricopeptide (TPR) repeat protein